MSFDEKIAALIQRLPKLTDHLQTEEATKNALVMPFIAALGYDVFNPKEVVPEFTADVGTKKGEKVDYAIMKDNETCILIECKKANGDLCHENMNQLYRYFTVTKARIAILTNGIQYRFYSDLEETNKMDNKPFLELDLANPKLNALAEVKKMAKEDFDLDRMLSTASELKYTSEIKKVLITQSESPDEEFVRYFFQRVMPGSRFTASYKELFTPLVSKAFHQFLSDRISDRLRSALENEKDKTNDNSEVDPESSQEDKRDGIVTTEEELEGWNIVRAICAKLVSPSRVVHRDTKSYMGILLDDNNRKPICRLWFNGKQKYLGVLDANKEETRVRIDSVVDIYLHADKILEIIATYETNEK
ncbi:MAG: type I restriction enzyme HsdR N-terminal domain-containing protein [Desulfuromonadales bacterium]|nr:type I restriction enzyme HsdR N-terminal domain-containing protein [Desulfuromonadales bacterium]MDT8423445.1 type I restriction enzyme HsdR N-terminal domain-containing protein [Desulfuromonadales bacterium]